MNIEQNIRKLTSTVQKHNLNSGGWLGITGSAIISGAQTTPTGVFAVTGSSTPLFMLRLFYAEIVHSINTNIQMVLRGTVDLVTEGWLTCV